MKEVFVIDFLMGLALGDPLRFLQRFLIFNGKPIHLHAVLIKAKPITSREQVRVRLMFARAI